MRHCAFDYLKECQEQAVLIGSICRKETGRREATAMFVRNTERWAVRQVRRFGNRIANPSVVRAAEAVAGALGGWGVPRVAPAANDDGWICE